MKSNIFEKVLNSVSLDPRIKDGIFNLEENEHMDILREYFIGKGIPEESVIEFCNNVVEGKYPERQAYNAKGILVTFPTPEYKQQAIKRGTHFEEDPTKRAANVFSNEPAAPAPTPASAPKQPKDDTKTSLPLSQATQPSAEPAAPAKPESPGVSTQEPPPAATTAAPQQASEPEAEPVEPTELPPPTPKSPAEKEADKHFIKGMLKGDDYMLEQVAEWIAYNGPDYLVEALKKKK